MGTGREIEIIEGGFWRWEEALRAAAPLRTWPKPLDGGGGGRGGQNDERISAQTEQL